jgi:hypothetical protein
VSQKTRRLAVAALFLLWLFAVFVAYYVVHKPFELANLRAVGQAAAGLAGAGLVVALGMGIGLILLRSLDLAPLERLVWAAALGLGAVSLMGLGLGAVADGDRTVAVAGAAGRLG